MNAQQCVPQGRHWQCFSHLFPPQKSTSNRLLTKLSKKSSQPVDHRNLSSTI